MIASDHESELRDNYIRRKTARSARRLLSYGSAARGRIVQVCHKGVESVAKALSEADPAQLGTLSQALDRFARLEMDALQQPMGSNQRGLKAGPTLELANITQDGPETGQPVDLQPSSPK